MVDYDDFYEPVQQSFVKVVLIFGGVALVLVLFMFQMFRLQERDRRSATEISDLKTLNQTSKSSTAAKSRWPTASGCR